MSKPFRTVKQAAIVDRVPQLNARLIDVAADFENISDQLLTGWAISLAFTVKSGTRDGNGALVSADIVWPDGATGVFTATDLSTDFPGAVDGWTATYLKEGVTITVTQPVVTRNVDGAVTAQPVIVITR